MRHNQNEYTKFTQDKLGVVGLSYQNWLCRNTNARLFFTKRGVGGEGVLIFFYV